MLRSSPMDGFGQPTDAAAASLTDARTPRSSRTTPLHINAATGSSLSVIQEIIGTAPDAVRSLDALGRVPLHLAFLHGASEDVLLELVREYPSAADIPFPPVIDSERWKPRCRCYVNLRTDIHITGCIAVGELGTLMGRYELDLTMGLVNDCHVWRLVSDQGFRGATNVFLYRSFTKRWLVGEERNFAFGKGWLKSTDAGSASPLGLSWMYYIQAWTTDEGLTVTRAIPGQYSASPPFEIGTPVAAQYMGNELVYADGVITESHVLRDGSGRVYTVKYDADGEEEGHIPENAIKVQMTAQKGSPSLLAQTTTEVDDEGCVELTLTTPGVITQAGAALGPLPVAFIKQAFVDKTMLEVTIRNGYGCELCLVLFRATPDKIMGKTQNALFMSIFDSILTSTGRPTGCASFSVETDGDNGKKLTTTLLRTFLRECPSLAAQADARGKTPLEYAFDVSTMTPYFYDDETLLAIWRAAPDAVFSCSQTALHLAVAANASASLIETICNASPTAAAQMNEVHEFPLHVALSTMSFATTSAALDGVSSSTQSKSSERPGFCAKGHSLVQGAADYENGWCDSFDYEWAEEEKHNDLTCKARIESMSNAWSCIPCGVDFCGACNKKLSDVGGGNNAAQKVDRQMRFDRNYAVITTLLEAHREAASVLAPKSGIYPLEMFLARRSLSSAMWSLEIDDVDAVGALAEASMQCAFSEHRSALHVILASECGCRRSEELVARVSRLYIEEEEEEEGEETTPPILATPVRTRGLVRRSTMEIAQAASPVRLQQSPGQLLRDGEDSDAVFGLLEAKDPGGVAVSFILMILMTIFFFNLMWYCLIDYFWAKGFAASEVGQRRRGAKRGQNN